MGGRSLVTPGLTGLWPVSGRSERQEGEALKLDLRYVEIWFLDAELTGTFRRLTEPLPCNIRRGLKEPASHVRMRPAICCRQRLTEYKPDDLYRN